MKNVLVIGLGEIGSSLVEVLNEAGDINIFKRDIEDLEINEEIDVMYICIPYLENFVDVVVSYIEKYKPKLTIINSTVRPGTTQKIYEKVGGMIVHSPVRGKHPDLKEGILHFVKFIGPTTPEAGKIAEEHFKSVGVKTEILKSSVNTELAKLFSTTYYGLCIAWHQEMERMCKEFNVEFDETFTRFNETYNEGCKDTNPKVVRPVLFPGFIGGHCVMPNIDLLQRDFDSDFLKTIVKSNKIKEKELEK